MKKVSPGTLVLYQKAIKSFEKWCREQSASNSSRENMDFNVCRYLDILAMQGTRINDCSYLVYGLQLLKSRLPSSQFLANSKSQLAGWRHGQPGNMRLGVAEEFVDAGCSYAVLNGMKESALAAQISMDTYFRPSETVNLQGQNLLPPAGGRYSGWAALLASSGDGSQQRTKNGDTDAGVIVGDKSRAWLNDALSSAAKHLAGDEYLFDFDLWQYEGF